MACNSEGYRATSKSKASNAGITAIVFFAGLANASEWIGVYLFAAAHEEPLRKYLELPNGIPSCDTIQWVFAMVSPEYLQEFRRRWNEITAIPELLKQLNVQGTIVTTYAMGCQTDIARQIRKGKADYMLGLKGNQGTLHEDVDVFR